jgi:arylsulfatase A-like enzyme
MQAHVLLLTGLGLLALGGCGDSDSGPDNGGEPAEEPPPNILFIVVDDAGVDQFEAFGYGGATPADTHNINAIAEAGVRFRNTWSMPTCSPTRATFFNGRYPFRSGVRNAIVSTDLANSQPSPYALTIPKLLREEKGYVSALVGKMHLSGSDLNPANHPMHDNAMRELGWDYFAGYLDGAPYPIDTTAGGVAPEGTYQCGFVPTTAADGDHGADFGVCYLPDNDPSGQPWTVMQNSATPGRTCLELGGILDPGTLTASEERRAQLDFDIQNGYYTGEWKINYENGDNETLFADNPRARGYRLILEAQYAIDWIVDKQSLESDTPWMMTVGFSALHAPLQPPPTALLPHPDATLSLLGCGTPVADALAELGLPATGDIADFAQQRVVAQHMLEAVDHEIGRLLEDTHIADRQDDGSLRYNPDSNTVVVLVGDNGTYMPSVKLPFDPLRAKGSLYQTGVWVPLLVAGPASIVHSPDRDVEHQVNTTDLFSLFREIAGIDASALPAWLTLDAQPLRPYLEEPGRTGIRDYNFSEQGTNIAATPPPPCVIPAANTCVQIFPQEAVCADQGGVWYGPDENGNGGFDSCCAVNDQLISQNDEPVEIFPQDQRTLRNEHYKLVRISRQDCELDTLVDSEEFYRIDQAIPTPELDRADANLIANGEGDLNEEQAANLTTLRDQLDQLLATATDCTGDGNDDLLVDQTDLDEWAYWADTDAGRGLSSWYDLNHDGLTDAADRAIIEGNMGADCRSTQNR